MRRLPNSYRFLPCLLLPLLEQVLTYLSVAKGYYKTLRVFPQLEKFYFDNYTIIEVSIRAR